MFNSKCLAEQLFLVLFLKKNITLSSYSTASKIVMFDKPTEQLSVVLFKPQHVVNQLSMSSTNA
jgi:hypothetical protein